MDVAVGVEELGWLDGGCVGAVVDVDALLEVGSGIVCCVVV